MRVSQTGDFICVRDGMGLEVAGLSQRDPNQVFHIYIYIYIYIWENQFFVFVFLFFWFLVFFGRFWIKYGIPSGPEAFRKLLDHCGSIVIEYEPVASHHDPIHPQNDSNTSSFVRHIHPIFVVVPNLRFSILPSCNLLNYGTHLDLSATPYYI